MRKGNKRDTKFLIFQSLYIIAIAILFFKGTDLSLTEVIEKTSDTTNFYDPKIDTLLPKLTDGSVYVKVKPGENEIDRLRKEIDSLSVIINSLKAENNNLKSQNATLRSTNSRLESEVARLKTELRICLGNQ
ncbi:MAG: hypothetical protein IPM96_10305 [Ignavibacteria bacterium]|nr:hypothetical protein [Ignavibacteria bacterium]